MTLQYHTGGNVDWNEVLFSAKEGFYKQMEPIAKQRFSDGNVAEEAVNFALSRMQENNWQKLNQYTGKNGASPTTFLYRVFINLLSDYRDKIYGRIRPPTWVKQKGQAWITAFNCLFIEQVEKEQLYVKLQCYSLSVDDVNEMVSTIKRRYKFKIPTYHLASDDANLEEKQSVAIKQYELPDQELIIYRERLDNITQILAAILMLADEGECSGVLCHYLKILNISFQDIKFLKLIYIDMHSLAEISRMLDCKYHIVAKRKKKIEQQLHILATNHLKF